MIYRTATCKINSNILFQNCFDSSDNTFFVIVYNGQGNKIKNCEKAYSEHEAEEIAFGYCRIKGLV